MHFAPGSLNRTHRNRQYSSESWLECEKSIACYDIMFSRRSSKFSLSRVLFFLEILITSILFSARFFFVDINTIGRIDCNAKSPDATCFLADWLWTARSLIRKRIPSAITNKKCQKLCKQSKNSFGVLRRFMNNLFREKRLWQIDLSPIAT